MTTTPTYWVGAMISVCHNSSGLPPSVFGGDGGGSGRDNERTNRVGVRPGGHPQKSPWGSFCETNGDVEFSLLRVQIVLVNEAKYKMYEHVYYVRWPDGTAGLFNGASVIHSSLPPSCACARCEGWIM